MAHKTHIIRPSAQAHWKNVHLKALANELQQTLGREPTPEELSASSGLSMKQINRIQQSIKSIVSLDDLEVVEHPKLAFESEGSSSSEYSEWMNLLLVGCDTLAEDEQSVIIGFFGLGQDSRDTLGDLAKTLGVSKAQVQLTKTAALQKLKVFFEERGFDGTQLPW